MSGVCIGVLALQGAFREHVRMLTGLGLRTVEVRRPHQLEGIHGLILPGGESTVIGTLLVEWELLKPIRRRVLAGMPIYGTCAGLILLCDEIEGYPDQPRLGLLNATVRRNAFGRQVDSFTAPLAVTGMAGGDFPAMFIRAPVLIRTGPQVRVLARLGEQAVAVRQGCMLGASFHPELTDDNRLHAYFANMAREMVKSARHF